MNTEQWKASVVEYENLVFTICYQLVHDYQEAQNLTQETFLSAYIHRESCKVETVKPWLARIAANKAKDYLKSAYFRRVKTEEGEEKMDDALLPDESFLEKEGEQHIRQYIEELEEPYAKVSRMHFLEDRKVDEIAACLKRPKKTVQTQLYRAKKILQGRIKGEG